MSSEHLASAQNELKGNLGGAWNILDGAQGQYQDLGIARRFGGSSAAYSLRDIGAMNGKVVRVRREPNDTTAGIDDEINFSANQVQSGALENWVNGKLESTLPADVATAAAAYSLRKVKDGYGIPVTEVNGTDGFPATLLQSEQSITGTSFTVRHFSNNSPDSSEATATNGVYRVSATKTSAATFAKAIRIKGLEDGKQYTVKGEFRMVEDTTSGGDSVAKVDISDNTAGTDEDDITTTSTTFVPFFIDAGYNSGSSDNFIDFTVTAIGSETGTITAEFRNVQIIENNNSAVRIRRSSDDEEVVVGFDSDNKVSASSPVTATPSGSTTATDLNGFLNESTENFSAIAYASIDSSYRNFTSDPNISETAFSGTNGGTASRLCYSLPLQLTISEADECKFKVTGTIDSLSGGDVTIKPTTQNNGGGSYTPAEGNKVISDGTTGAFEYIFTGDGVNEFKSVIFLIDASTTVSASNLKFEIIEHGATVHTWYDQAGVNNAVQETAANQPKIAENGALLDGIKFSSASDGTSATHLDIATKLMDSTDGFMSSVINSVQDMNQLGVIYGNRNNNSGFVFGIHQAEYPQVFYRQSSGANRLENTDFILSSSSKYLLSVDKDGTNDANLFGNAVSRDTDSSMNYITSTGSTSKIGQGGNTVTSDANGLNANINELIFYNSDQADDRFKIESNINNYYGLYNDANEFASDETAFRFLGQRATGGTSASSDLTQFTLDVETASAYAGAKLSKDVLSGDAIYVSFNCSFDSGSPSPKIALRDVDSALNGGVDSNEENVIEGFNSFTLTSTASTASGIVWSEGDDDVIFSVTDIKVSRIARDGFVETWYDQSGNGEDMTQGTAGKQPSIVLNGGQVKDYKGNNSIDFVSGSTRVLDKSGTTTAKTCIVVLDEDSSGSASRAILGFSDSTSFMRLDAGTDLELKAGGSTANYRAIPTDVTSLYFWYTNGTDEDKLFANNVEEGDLTANTPPNLPFTRIGARNSDSDPYNSRITEVIAFAEDLSADRTVLQDDINNNYNIF